MSPILWVQGSFWGTWLNLWEQESLHGTVGLVSSIRMSGEGATWFTSALLFVGSLALSSVLDTA